MSNLARALREGPLRPAEAFDPQPLDWSSLEAVPDEVDWLMPPYVPAGCRIWGWGPAESGKSLWALWLATTLTRRGSNVLYISSENPFREDVRRLKRLGPEHARLSFYSERELAEGFDLANPEHASWLRRKSAGRALVVLDTLTGCWTGDEGDNHAVAALDREVLQPLTRDTGAALLILDHTGHSRAFEARKGVSAGRGASSKGQKADVVLEFRAPCAGEFVIHHGKNRPGGGKKEADQLFRILDTPEGLLEVVSVGDVADAKVRETADKIVAAVLAAEHLTTAGVREAVPATKQVQNDAMNLLEAEEPPRLTAARETVETNGGPQASKVWRPAQVGDAS